MSEEKVKSILSTLVKGCHPNSVYIVKCRPVNSGGKDRERYSFFVKIGGHGKKMLATKHILNWIGNVAQGIAGAGLSGANLASNIAQLGAGTGALSGKGASLSGLSGAYRDGVLTGLGDMGDASGNNNLMHIFKANQGLQVVGHIDLTSSSYGIWWGDPNQSHGSEWRMFLRFKEEQDDSSYAMEDKFLWGQGVMYVNGVAKRMRNFPKR